MYQLWSTTVNYYQVSSAHNLISVIINIHQHIYQHKYQTYSQHIINTYKVETIDSIVAVGPPTSAAMISGSPNKVRQLGNAWVIHQDLNANKTT